MDKGEGVVVRVMNMHSVRRGTNIVHTIITDSAELDLATAQQMRKDGLLSFDGLGTTARLRIQRILDGRNAPVVTPRQIWDGPTKKLRYEC